MLLFCFAFLTQDRKHQSTAVIGKMKQTTTTTNENAIWLRTLLTQKGETLKDRMAGRI